MGLWTVSKVVTLSCCGERGGKVYPAGELQ